MDQALREKVLTFLLELYTSADLSEWLRALGVDTHGTVSEKKQRVRQHTQLSSLPTNKVLEQLIPGLRESDIEWTEDLCKEFGLSLDGPKALLVRRVHRYIATREGQLPPYVPRSEGPTIDEVQPIVSWYPVYQSKAYEKDHYGEFRETMADIFGETQVHEQMPVAHGGTLKIDFHIGSPIPGQGGVGVEFKMPANNSDVQRALGQIGQYQSRYGESLVIVIFPDLLETKHLVPFQNDLDRVRIRHVLKKRWGEE